MVLICVFIFFIILVTSTIIKTTSRNNKENYCNSLGMELKIVGLESYCYDIEESKLHQIISIRDKNIFYFTYSKVPIEFKLTKEVVTLE